MLRRAGRPTCLRDRKVGTAAISGSVGAGPEESRSVYVAGPQYTDKAYHAQCSSVETRCGGLLARSCLDLFAVQLARHAVRRSSARSRKGRQAPRRVGNVLGSGIAARDGGKPPSGCPRRFLRAQGSRQCRRPKDGIDRFRRSLRDVGGLTLRFRSGGLKNLLGQSDQRLLGDADRRRGGCL